jgi:hypothetical protein
MAAAATDKVRKKKSNFSTTLSAGINDSTSTVPLSSSSGLPSDTAVTLTIDRVDANSVSTPSLMERVTGVVGVNQLTSAVRGVEGSAQSHNSGAIVEDIWEAATWNDICTAFLVSHSQDGYLKSGTRIADTTGDHQYVLGVSELAANRTITLPLLLSADTFAFNNHIGAMSNKTMYAMTLSGDMNMGASDNLTPGGVDPWRTMTLMPGFLKPTTTSGCAASSKIEAGTNDVDYDVLDFDQTAQERSFVNVPMPESWDGGVVQFRFWWTAAAGTAAQTFELEMGGRSFANDDAVDQAMGTFVGVSDALIATGDIHTSDWSADVTLTGAGAGEMVHLEFRRDVATDTLAADARLIGVQVRFKQAKYTD